MRACRLDVRIFTHRLSEYDVTGNIHRCDIYINTMTAVNSWSNIYFIHFFLLESIFQPLQGLHSAMADAGLYSDVCVCACGGVGGGTWLIQRTGVLNSWLRWCNEEEKASSCLVLSSQSAAWNSDLNRAATESTTKSRIRPRANRRGTRRDRHTCRESCR